MFGLLSNRYIRILFEFPFLNSHFRCGVGLNAHRLLASPRKHFILALILFHGLLLGHRVGARLVQLGPAWALVIPVQRIRVLENLRALFEASSLSPRDVCSLQVARERFILPFGMGKDSKALSR